MKSKDIGFGEFETRVFDAKPEEHYDRDCIKTHVYDSVTFDPDGERVFISLYDISGWQAIHLIFSVEQARVFVDQMQEFVAEFSLEVERRAQDNSG